ncbi:MAG: hypothetical protein WCE53_10525 [Candidatus Acidiferrum sp.]
MENVIVWLLVTLVGSFGGSLFGAYFKKKGENYATHEDLGKLVEQVEAVTAATKQIEAKISDEVWNRQRRWELKREVLFGLVKTIGDLSDKLTALHSVYQVSRVKPGGIGTVDEHKELERIEAWSKTATELDTAILLVGTVCGAELKKVVLEFGLFCRRIVVALQQGDPDAFMRSVMEFTTKREEVLAAIQRELGLDK